MLLEEGENANALWLSRAWKSFIDCLTRAGVKIGLHSSAAGKGNAIPTSAITFPLDDVTLYLLARCGTPSVH